MIARHTTRFLLKSKDLWSFVMRAKYDSWEVHEVAQALKNASFLWHEFYDHALEGLAISKLMLGDGRLVDIMDDISLPNLFLWRWPTMFCMEF